MKKAGKSIFTAVICAVFAVIYSLTAMIPACAEIDTSRFGRITFKITSSETGESVGGGSVAVYRVASVTAGGSYTLESDFASLGVDVNALADSDTSWSDAAESMALYIKNHSLEDRATVVEIGEDGSAVLSRVVPGLYVAVQKEEPKGYCAFKPFIIPLPLLSGSEPKYDLDAMPKGTAKLPAKECVVVLPSIRKTVKGANRPVNTEFRFRVKALEKGYPEIVNTSGSVENGGNVVSQSADEIVIRIKGEDVVEIGSITFDRPGDYYYEASEINTGETGYQYDKSVYWFRYSIRLNKEHNALVVSNVTVKRDNANGTVLYDGEGPLTLAFDFINFIPDIVPPPPDDPPPDTGQVWWPVTVFAAVGALFIISGIVLYKRGDKKSSNGQTE